MAATRIHTAARATVETIQAWRVNQVPNASGPKMLAWNPIKAKVIDAAAKGAKTAEGAAALR